MTLAESVIAKHQSLAHGVNFPQNRSFRSGIVDLSIEVVECDTDSAVYRFVYHSWTRSGLDTFVLENGIDGGNEADLDAAKLVYSRRVKSLIPKSRVTLATTEVDGEKAFLGWACHDAYDEKVLHYCYVKSAVRKHGIAKKLCTPKAAPRLVSWFTHRTHRNQGFMDWLEDAFGARYVGL